MPKETKDLSKIGSRPGMVQNILKIARQLDREFTTDQMYKILVEEYDYKRSLSRVSASLSRLSSTHHIEICRKQGHSNWWIIGGSLTRSGYRNIPVKEIGESFINYIVDLKSKIKKYDKELKETIETNKKLVNENKELINKINKLL